MNCKLEAVDPILVPNHLVPVGSYEALQGIYYSGLVQEVISTYLPEDANIKIFNIGLSDPCSAVSISLREHEYEIHVVRAGRYFEEIDNAKKSGSEGYTEIVERLSKSEIKKHSFEIPFSEGEKIVEALNSMLMIVAERVDSPTSLDTLEFRIVLENSRLKTGKFTSKGGGNWDRCHHIILQVLQWGLSEGIDSKTFFSAAMKDCDEVIASEKLPILGEYSESKSLNCGAFDSNKMYDEVNYFIMKLVGL